jgi:diguanylate cyclase (GGDEF)-like protein
LVAGLPNRRYLALQMEGAIARAQRKQLGFAVLVIDLDGFKPINDAHGHSAGDLALVAVAERLHTLVRKGEVVARVGGDEFVVVVQRSDLLVTATNPAAETAQRTAQRLITALAQPIALPTALTYTSVQLGASVGVALYPCDGTTADELLRNADVAMYRAKQQGRGTTRFYGATETTATAGAGLAGGAAAAASTTQARSAETADL